jgi:hypothetical protein
MEALCWADDHDGETDFQCGRLDWLGFLTGVMALSIVCYLNGI